MKRLLALLTFFLAIPAFADTVPTGAMFVSFSSANNPASIQLYVNGITNGNGDGHPPFYFGTGNINVLSLTCANAGCTGYNTEVAISGIILNNVFFQRQHYNQIYLSGTLDLSARFVSSLSYDLTVASGTFTAYLNPNFSGQLFSFNVNFEEEGLFTVKNNGGTLTLTNATFITPEPTSIALLGTGFIPLLWRRSRSGIHTWRKKS